MPTAALVLILFAASAMWIALAVPFPTGVDELEHYSVVRAQAERPDLFADAGAYRILRADDVSAWSERRNYINHPPAYYLLLAPLTGLSQDVLAMRLFNVLLAFVALGVVIVAGGRLLSTHLERSVFAVLVVCFPKAAVVGGMINNDNLAALAGATVFAGLAGTLGGAGAAAWWLAGGLALAGWSKLTALLALGSVVALVRLRAVARGEATLWGRQNLVIAAGALIGLLPYLVNLWTSGRLLFFNAEHFHVPLAERAVLDPWQFAGAFLAKLAWKWPAAEGVLPGGLALLAVATPLAFAVVAIRRGGRLAPLAGAYMAALAVTLGAQGAFAWSAFSTIGDLSIAQARYYNVLWPGFALAGAVAIAWLAQRWRGVTVPALALYVLPTLPGAMLVALIPWR